MNKQEIIETVNTLFISVDNRDWNNVKEIFGDKVLLDYTSMSGGEPATLVPDQIIDSWKLVLPGFDKTHHQLGNHIVEGDAAQAKVFCYGTATHYLKNESNENIWTVVGSYEFHVDSEKGRWRIGTMKFNLKYVDGNEGLPQLAQGRLGTHGPA